MTMIEDAASAIAPAIGHRDALFDVLSLPDPTPLLLGVPSLPAFFVLSYGASRALSSLFNEARNATYSPQSFGRR